MLEDSVLGPVVTRRCVLRGLAASPALQAGAPRLQALTHLSGYWVLLVPTGDGNYRKTFLRLEQFGHTVAGEVMYGARKLPISNGSFQDGKLHFEVVVHFQQQTRQI